MKPHILYLSLGSNLGDRHATLHEALRLLSERLGDVQKVSSFIETEPVGFDSPHKFINACCCLSTTLTPQQCLHETQTIELLLGREKKTDEKGYFDRTIDIDLLLYDHLVINEPGLIIPHPCMKERDFVLTPLKEILPRP